jgi:hypothetical protein
MDSFSPQTSLGIRSWNSKISTGNKGVDQLIIKIFSKCGITLILFPLILALFSMVGCIDRGPQLSQVPSFGAENPQLGELSSHLQLDYEAEVKSNLFCAEGKVLLIGNGSLPYLMLNATLAQDGGTPLMRTKYLLMQLEPNRDYNFEISKNMRIQPGDYNCTLEVSGPEGTLALENRKCSLEEPLQDFKSSQIPLSLEAEFAKQKAQEEMAREEGVRAREMSREETLEDVMAEKKTLNEAGDAANIGTVTKDEDGTTASSKKKEKVEGSLATGTIVDENDSSPHESLPASSSNDATKVMFVGSSTSKKYHLLDCRYALKIKPENRISFQSAEAARRQGYLPCKSCNP